MVLAPPTYDQSTAPGYAPPQYAPPPEQGAYPPQPQQGAPLQQQGMYPPQGHPGAYPPQQGAYPPQQGAYHPQQGAYPPQQGAYPPQQGAYPPQQGAYPPQQGQPTYGAPQYGQPGMFTAILYDILIHIIPVQFNVKFYGTHLLFLFTLYAKDLQLSTTHIGWLILTGLIAVTLQAAVRVRTPIPT